MYYLKEYIKITFFFFQKPIYLWDELIITSIGNVKMHKIYGFIVFFLNYNFVLKFGISIL